jgi:hypothetical protein
MSLAEIEKRVATLEKMVAELQQNAQKQPENPWLSIIGHFANDPVYDEIVRLGREYRESLNTDHIKKKRPRKS